MLGAFDLLPDSPYEARLFGLRQPRLYGRGYLQDDLQSHTEGQ